MLNTPEQLAAFRELNQSGFTASASVTLAISTAAAAKLLADQLMALLLPDVTYPDSITGSLNAIRTGVNILNNVHAAGDGFASYFVTFQSLSELLNISTGWACYLKGESLPAESAPALADALGDTTVVADLQKALAAVNATSVVTAMNEINATLPTVIAAPAGSFDAEKDPEATSASLSDDLIASLASACSELETGLKTLTDVSAAVIKLTANGKQSVKLAKRAFSYAVSVALLNSMKGNAAMSAAVASVTPAAVLIALDGGE